MVAQRNPTTTPPGQYGAHSAPRQTLQQAAIAQLDTAALPALPMAPTFLPPLVSGVSAEQALRLRLQAAQVNASKLGHYLDQIKATRKALVESFGPFNPGVMGLDIAIEYFSNQYLAWFRQMAEDRRALAMLGREAAAV